MAEAMKVAVVVPLPKSWRQLTLRCEHGTHTDGLRQMWSSRESVNGEGHHIFEQVEQR